MERYGIIAQRNKDGSFQKARELYERQKKSRKKTPEHQPDPVALAWAGRLFLPYLQKAIENDEIRIC